MKSRSSATQPKFKYVVVCGECGVWCVYGRTERPPTHTHAHTRPPPPARARRLTARQALILPAHPNRPADRMHNTRHTDGYAVLH